SVGLLVDLQAQAQVQLLDDVLKILDGLGGGKVRHPRLRALRDVKPAGPVDGHAQVAEPGQLGKSAVEVSAGSGAARSSEGDAQVASGLAAADVLDGDGVAGVGGQLERAANDGQRAGSGVDGGDGRVDARQH